MRPCTSPLTVIALIICMALPAWGKQYLLYVPQPVTPSQNTSSQNGILVQEIEVRQGDTLYGLSRKFNGRGMYFPQILLFNSIKNPNLIHTGDTLRVPVAKQETNSSGLTDTKPAEASRKTGSSGSRKAAVKPESQPAATITASPTLTPGTDLSLSDLKRAGTRKTRTACQKSKSVHKKRSLLHIRYPWQQHLCHRMLLPPPLQKTPLDECFLNPPSRHIVKMTAVPLLNCWTVTSLPTQAHRLLPMQICTRPNVI